MFLSIVIPVHNAAPYLGNCLDSIWAQGIPEDDYEVICVDDCSTDAVKDCFDKQNSRSNFRYLTNTENLRAGGSRNRGVKAAKGEYIVFIDADDYYHPESLMKAYQYQKQNGLDLLVCDMSREPYGGPASTQMILQYKDQSICSGREFLLKNGFPGGPTKYFFKRSLMVDNNVWFEEKVACEDPDWAWRLPYYARRMQYQPILLHHYVIYPNSSVRREFKNPKATYDRMFCGKRLWELSNLYDRSEELHSVKYISGETFTVALRSMCALFDSPRTKAEVIERNIPPKVDYGFLVRFARRCPLLFGLLSTIFSPVTLLLLIAKRRLSRVK